MKGTTWLFVLPSSSSPPSTWGREQSQKCLRGNCSHIWPGCNLIRRPQLTLHRCYQFTSCADCNLCNEFSTFLRVLRVLCGLWIVICSPKWVTPGFVHVRDHHQFINSYRSMTLCDLCRSRHWGLGRLRRGESVRLGNCLNTCVRVWACLHPRDPGRRQPREEVGPDASLSRIALLSLSLLFRSSCCSRSSHPRHFIFCTTNRFPS